MQGICTEMDGSFSIAFTVSLACKTKRLVAETEFDLPSCAEKTSKQHGGGLHSLGFRPQEDSKVNESKVGRT